MNERLKKILIIIGFFLVAAGFCLAIYLIFFKPSSPLPVTNEGGNVNGLPGIENGNINGQPVENGNFLPIVNELSGTTGPNPVADGGSTLVTPITTKISDGLMLNPNSGAVQFYNREEGKFYKLNPDGTTTLLTDAVYPEVDTVTWAPNGNSAILKFPDGSKVLYSFDKKQQTSLPGELDDFYFSPDSRQIVSKYLDPRNTENQWLMVSNPDGTGMTSVEQLAENAGKVTTSWSPNNQIIAMYPEAVNSDLSDVYFLGANSENFTSATIEGRGFIPKWSPDGSKILYSSYSSLTRDNPHLFIMNGQIDALGSGITDLGLTTQADKCTFSQNGYTLYCAVPHYMNAGSGPQPILSYGIPDNIYKIDLLSGYSSLVARPADAQGKQRYSAEQLQLSADEMYLYFNDVNTNTIQRIQLGQ